MVREHEEKPEADASEEQAGEASRETAVGHSVVEEPAAGHGAGDPEQASAGGTPFSGEEPAPAPQPAAAPATESGGTSPAAADRRAADARDSFTEKPELFVAAAFAGAFLLGKLLKRLTGSDD